eukprot:TRINITY_DN12304_c0_g1_i1.p1 TRINITY_DN12304_c0_g1~~TRINITY_DN12304_c0_g1_i1.p1  ORF type:complete len:1422 (-),score=289.94 TRINITY_DN12304_c0_g1_i1:71-4336(-)
MVFACMGAREKSGITSTVTLVEIRGEPASASTVRLNFGLASTVSAGADELRDAPVTVLAQRLDVGTFSSAWISVPDSEFKWWMCEEENELSADADADEDCAGAAQSVLQCEAILSALEPEADCTFRLLAKGDSKENLFISAEAACRTADRPVVHEGCLEFSSRSSSTLELLWFVADPLGEPVEECEAQIRLDGFMSGWAPAEGEFAPVGSATGGGRHWRCVIEGLRGATGYRIRARARNAVGWSVGHSQELVCRTSELPRTPANLVVHKRCVTAVAIECVVRDPDGAPVETCVVDLLGVMGYYKHPTVRFEPVRSLTVTEGEPGRLVHCTIEELEPAKDYWVRIWTQNSSGMSRQPSAPLLIRTSDRPQTPVRRLAQVGPRALEVIWETEDPEGAPVLGVDVDYCVDALMAGWSRAEAVLVEETEEEPQQQERLEVVAAGRIRTWRLLLEGLERETAYLVCARTRNVVGWSDFTASENFATSDRPPPPEQLRCTKRLPSAVCLELAVKEVLGTAPVSALQVELSTSFAWSEVKSVEVARLPAQQAGMSRWNLMVTLGTTPGQAHKLRVWASNAFGRSVGPSAVVTCRTSDRPQPPARQMCVASFPHSMEMEWFVPDPEGAPVRRFEVQCKKDKVLSSWQPTVCLDVRRVGDMWRCVVDQLEPNSTYYLCARAWNEAGWSDWVNFEDEFKTSLSPGPPASLAVRHLPASTAGAAGGAGSGPRAASPAAGAPEGRVEVEVLLPDPEGAPVVACMVRRGDHRGSGSWTLCRRSDVHARGGKAALQSLGRWRATLPLTADEEKAMQSKKAKASDFNVAVRAANAVGWLKTGETCRVVADAEAAAEEPAEGRSAVDLLVEQVRVALQRASACKARVESLQTDESARAEHEQALMLARYAVELERRIRVLEEASRHLGTYCKSYAGCAAGGAVPQALEAADPDVAPEAEDGEAAKAEENEGGAPEADGQQQQRTPGAELVAELGGIVNRSVLMPDALAAARVISTLLRGYLWLEHWWRPELRELREDIESAAGSVSAAGGGVLHSWARQHQAWSANFDRRVADALPEGLATSAQLLATLASGRSRLELFKTVRGDTEACLTLVSAAERQLKKLRQSHRILHAAEAASCIDFEGRGVLKKIETTALGLITMLVLPVPGSIEVGAVGIGTLWLEGDPSNSHVALEHPQGVPLAPALQRLGSCPPPRAAVILAGWASGGHRGVVLVHNATAQRITVSVQEESISSKAFQKLSDAHPMVKAVGSALSSAAGGDSEVTILPTDVALLQVPAALGGEAVSLNFAYGPAAHAGRPVGHSRVPMGTAVTFMNLESRLQVSNGDGEHAIVEEGTISIFNNDLEDVTASLYRVAEDQSHFESAQAQLQVESGKERHIALPQPCAGRLFQLEVTSARAPKAICEVRPGQRVTVEAAGD